MQTGRDPVHSSDKPRDFPDRVPNDHVLIALTQDADSSSGATGWDEGQIDMQSHCWDICETWQIREVASPQAVVQGRGGAIRVQTSKMDPLLIELHPPPLGDWATDKLYDWADKMVHAAPSRCCVMAADDTSKTGAAVWRSHNGSARCGGVGF